MMKSVHTLNRAAWGWIRPDGSFVVDSQMEDEDHCWQIGLGWPDARREIEEAKRKGWKVCRFLVAPIQNAAPPELPAVTSASRPDDQIVSASKEDCQGSAKGVRDSAKYPAAAAQGEKNG